MPGINGARERIAGFIFRHGKHPPTRLLLRRSIFCPMLSSPRLVLSLLFLALTVGTSNCRLIQVQQQFVPTFAYAEMRISEVQTASLGGLNVTATRQVKDLTAGKRRRLAAAYATGKLPLKLQIELELRNSSQEQVQLTDLRYQTLVDGQLVAEGHDSQPLNLLPEGRGSILLYAVESDVRSTINDLTLDNLGYFALRLTDQTRQPVRVTMRLKPTFRTSGGRLIQPAGWVTINENFTASNAQNEQSVQ